MGSQPFGFCDRPPNATFAIEDLLLDLCTTDGSREVVKDSFLGSSASFLIASWTNLRIIRIQGGIPSKFGWGTQFASSTFSPLPLSTALNVFVQAPNLTVLWFDVTCVATHSDSDDLPISPTKSLRSLGLNLLDQGSITSDTTALLFTRLFPDIDLRLCQEDLMKERDMGTWDRDIPFPEWGMYLKSWGALISSEPLSWTLQ